MKQYIGDCTGGTFSSQEKQDEILFKARKMSKKKFLLECNVDDETKADMKRFPHDYIFWRYKDICFHEWSRIDFFYK